MGTLKANFQTTRIFLSESYSDLFQAPLCSLLLIAAFYCCLLLIAASYCCLLLIAVCVKDVQYRKRRKTLRKFPSKSVDGRVKGFYRTPRQLLGEQGTQRDKDKGKFHRRMDWI